MASPLQVSKIATLTGHRDCVYTLERSAQVRKLELANGDEPDFVFSAVPPRPTA